MTPKNNVVRLRLTELEREAWATAAGGKGKLSEWIRATCNKATLGSPVGVCPSEPPVSTEVHPGRSTGGPSAAVPREEPVAARPRARAGDAAKLRGDAETGPEQQALPSSYAEAFTEAIASLPPGAVVPVQAGEDLEHAAVKAATENCARWMHHRKSVYCGTCKRVN